MITPEQRAEFKAAYQKLVERLISEGNTEQVNNSRGIWEGITDFVDVGDIDSEVWNALLEWMKSPEGSMDMVEIDQKCGV